MLVIVSLYANFLVSNQHLTSLFTYKQKIYSCLTVISVLHILTLNPISTLCDVKLQHNLILARHIRPDVSIENFSSLNF